MFRALTAFNATVSRWCMYLAVTGLIGIVTVVGIQVFGRYVLNDTPIWAESTALVLILYVTMLGAAVGVRDAGHIGLESLLVLVPDGLRLKLEVVIHVLVGTFGLVMAWNGGVLAESVMAYKIPTLGLPEGINHLPLVISGVLIALFSLEHIVALLRGVGTPFGMTWPPLMRPGVIRFESFHCIASVPLPAKTPRERDQSFPAGMPPESMPA